MGSNTMAEVELRLSRGWRDPGLPRLRNHTNGDNNSLHGVLRRDKHEGASVHFSARLATAGLSTLLGRSELLALALTERFRTLLPLKMEAGRDLSTHALA
jgi:hypothetical protein